MTGLFTIGGIAAFCIFFAKSPGLAIRAILTLVGFVSAALGTFIYNFSSTPDVGIPWAVGGFALLAFISWTGQK